MHNGTAASAQAVADAVYYSLTQSAQDVTSCLATDTLVDDAGGGRRNTVDALYAIALSLKWIHQSLERLADIAEASNDQERAA